MIDFQTQGFKAKPLPMPWAEFETRARAEGIWDKVLEAGVIAGMAGADEALAHVALPDWAAQAVRNQFPAVPPLA